MKTLALALTVGLLATPAFAQMQGNTRQAPNELYGSNAPIYQRGSGQQSGGYAREIIPPSGQVMVGPGVGMVDPDATGSIVPAPGFGFAAGDNANARQQPLPGANAPVPSFQQGSGQQSGGYANELNRF